MSCPDEDYKGMIAQIQSGEVKPLGAGGFGEVFRVGDYIVKRIEIVGDTDISEYNKETRTWKMLSQNPAMKPYMPNFCTSRHIMMERPPKPEMNYSLINRSKINEQFLKLSTWYKEHGRKPLAIGFIFQKYEPVKDLYELIYGEWTAQKLEAGKGYALFIELVKAFDIFHSAGYIHRDIKPENILIRDGDMQPLIVDFGLACATPCEDTFAVGTTAYVSPNIIPQNADERQNGVCEFPVKQRQMGIFERMKRSLGCSRAMRTAKTKVRVKVTNTLAEPEFNRASDRYSLSLVLQELANVIDWTTAPDLKKQADDVIRKYRASIIPYLASSIAKKKGAVVGAGTDRSSGTVRSSRSSKRKTRRVSKKRV
jgi:serine/threonine protein kinase